jgi:hypothetical protein
MAEHERSLMAGYCTWKTIVPLTVHVLGSDASHAGAEAGDM